MKNGIIGTEKGGYDKKDVLNKIDAFMALFKKMQNGISSAEAKETLIEINKMPLNEVDSDTEGFDKHDTNGYFSKLEYDTISYFMKP